MAYEANFVCDKCGEVGGLWINLSVKKSTATKIARGRGWQVGKKGWFCPRCRTVKRRIKPNER